MSENQFYFIKENDENEIHKLSKTIINLDKSINEKTSEIEKYQGLSSNLEIAKQQLLELRIKVENSEKELKENIKNLNI